MKIPISVEGDLAREYNGLCITLDLVRSWPFTSPISMIECIRNNASLFSEEEKEIITSLLDSGEYENRVIAYWLITNKEDEKEI